MSYRMGRALVVLAALASTVSCEKTRVGYCSDNPDFWGCDLDGGSSDAKPDADGGSSDAEPDADGADAEDAREDGGRADWIRLPGVPERCDSWLARDASELVEPLRFEACPDRAGCRQLVTDWYPDPELAIRINGIATASGFHDGRRGHFFFARPGTDGRPWWVVADDTGAILALLRSHADEPRWCGIGGLAIGEGHLGIQVKGSTDPEHPVAWSLGADLAEPAGTVRLLAYHGPDLTPGEFAQFLRVGRGGLFYEVTGELLFHVGWDGSLTRIEDESGQPVHGYPGSIVDHDMVFGSTDCCKNRIVASTRGEPPRVLVDPPDPVSEASEIGQTDGRTIAWLQGEQRIGGSPSMFERVDLYAASYAREASGIEPRLLATMENPGIHYALTAGFGHVAVVDDDATVIRFFRVSDGHETELHAPSGLVWTGFVVYIGPREVLVAAGPDPGITTHVQLIDYTELEP